jgi:uncharacterized protein YeaO (DUF488 family)
MTDANKESVDQQAIWDEFTGETSAAESASPEPDVQKSGIEQTQQDSSADNEGNVDSTADSRESPSPEQDADSDPWATVPAELREQFEKTQKQNAEFQRRLTDQGRQLKDLRTQNLHGQPAPQKEATKAPEKWESFKQEYPEVAAPIDEMLQAVLSKADRLEQQLAGMSKAQVQDVYQSNLEYVKSQHPDFDQIVGGTEFKEWVDRQPRFIQEGIQRNATDLVDAVEASEILNLYKSQNVTSAQQVTQAAPLKPGNNISGKRARQLETAAVGPSRTQASVMGGVPNDPERQFDWAIEVANKQRNGQ